MNLYKSSIFWILISSFFLIHAKNPGTLIGQFEIDFDDLKGKAKTFINNSKYDLIIRSTLKEPGTLRQFAQEPILRRGDLITITFDKGLAYLEGAKQLEHSLELLRVKKMPKGAEQPLVTHKLKDGSYAFTLHKSKFLKHDTFELSLNKNGLLVCKVSSAPRARA